MRAFLATVICLIACVCGSAQDWERTIGQYQHTAWGPKEGAPDEINALVQTEDGYLWLGTRNGLYRFDGVTFEHYEPRSGGPLPSSGRVFRLWSRGRGELWIGAYAHVSVLKDGNLRIYGTQDGVPDGLVLGFAEDREGTIWIATLGGLARLEGTHWRKVGDDWNFPGRSAQAVFLDRDGTLWVATEKTLVFLPLGATAFQPTGIYVGQVLQIAQAPNGKLWMPEASRSIRPIPLGSRQLPPDETEIRVGSIGILFDREGALWATTLGDGLRRAPHPERLTGKPGRFSELIESYTTKDGLTDDSSGSILEDREGNIWIATANGLDRFRKSNLVPVVLPVPLREPIMVAGNDGDLWLKGTNLWARIKRGHAITKGDGIVVPPEGPLGAYRDPVGTIWLIGGTSLLRFEKGRFTAIPLPEELFSRVGGQDVRLAEDRSGVLWVAASNAGLFSMRDSVWKRRETSLAIAGMDPRAAYTDWMGRVWFGYLTGEIIVIDNGNIQLLSPKGSLGHLAAINGRGRHIWVGGNFGLAFYDGTHFQPVIPADATTFGLVWGIEEDREGGLWLGHYPGVIHIAEGEIQHFLSDSSYRAQYQRFDSLDGLPGSFRPGSNPVEGTDGRLWFAAANGLAWLDPAHLSRNTLPPPVSVRSLTADGKLYPYWTNVGLPPLTKSLQIQFTALSLSIPERVRFRYRLDGFDTDWQDGGARREALYANLSPRKYRFHVIAGNNDGVWNETGATLDFSVLPTWYQATAFRISCVLGAVFLLWFLYYLRIKQASRALRARFEERTAERTRLARDLHDTLLQTLQGSKLVADHALENHSDAEHMRRSLEKLSQWIDRAIREGRAALNALHVSTFDNRELSKRLQSALDERELNGVSEKFLTISGTPVEMDPILTDEICQVGYEAIRNAFMHSHATRVEVQLTYSEDFTLIVRDNGRGMDSTLASRGRDGHFGLQSMRERAARIHGQFQLITAPHLGTAIELKMEGKRAFGRATSMWSKLFYWMRRTPRPEA